MLLVSIFHSRCDCLLSRILSCICMYYIVSQSNVIHTKISRAKILSVDYFQSRNEFPVTFTIYTHHFGIFSRTILDS